MSQLIPFSIFFILILFPPGLIFVWIALYKSLSLPCNLIWQLLLVMKSYGSIILINFACFPWTISCSPLIVRTLLPMMSRASSTFQLTLRIVFVQLAPRIVVSGDSEAASCTFHNYFHKLFCQLQSHYTLHEGERKEGKWKITFLIISSVDKLLY